MAKILSKSGTSLADLYDVQGSIAGIDDLLSNDVNLVHEMGGTIFSERVGATVVAISATALAQTVGWNVRFTLGDEIMRILALSVVTTTPGRLSQVSISISDLPGSVTDCPIWIWKEGELEIVATLAIDGTDAARVVLVPTGPPLIPNIVVGSDSRFPAPVLSFRGLTTTFGAGTVTPQMIVYFLKAFQGSAPSVKGLPLPSW